MTAHPPGALSRRERQVMDALYRLEEGTVSDLVREVRDGVSYSAVRAVLRVLEEKGHVTHRAQGRRYVYSPTLPADAARSKALRHVVRTFFDGSLEAAAHALFDLAAADLDPATRERLTRRIREAEGEGR